MTLILVLLCVAVLLALFTFSLTFARKQGLSAIPGSILNFSHPHLFYVGAMFELAALAVWPGWIAYATQFLVFIFMVDSTWQVLYLIISRHATYESPLQRLWGWWKTVHILHRSTW